MMGGLKVLEDEDGKTEFEDSRVFFGYEMMTATDAKAYIEADNAFVSSAKGEDTATALKSLVDKQAAANPDDGLIRVPTRMSMLELGFSPTFYQFVDTIIEVKIAIKITRTIEVGRSSRNTANQSANSSTKSAGVKFGFGRVGVNSGATNNSQATTSQVDATYSAKYSYSAEGSSLLRTKLVPLPPPPILEERIRRLLDEEATRRQKTLDKKLTTPTPTPT
jgi:hypothetical protein